MSTHWPLLEEERTAAPIKRLIKVLMTKPIYTFSTENLNIKYKARLRKRTSVVLLLHIFGKNCLPAVLTRWNDETDPPFTTFQGAVMMLLHEPQGFFQTAF